MDAEVLVWCLRHSQFCLPIHCGASKLHGPVWNRVREFIDDEEGLEKLVREREKVDLSPILEEAAVVEGLIRDKQEEIEQIALAIPKQRGFMKERLEANGQQAQDQLEQLEAKLSRLRVRRQIMAETDAQIMELAPLLAKIRDALRLVEAGDREGRIDSDELRRLQVSAYKALDIQVLMRYYPEDATTNEKQRGPAHFTISSVLGPMLTRFRSSAASNQGRISETDLRIL